MSRTKQTRSNLMGSRPGTKDLGKLYEQKIPALLAIKCIFNSDVKDIKMASNLQGLGAFDDLVLFTEKKSGEKNIFLLQLKHKQNKKIRSKLLTSTDKDFGLGKYQENFRDIKNKYENGELLFIDRWCDFHSIVFVIFTNAPMASNESEASKIPNAKLDSNHNKIILEEQTDPNMFLNTGTIFKISNREPETYDVHFLEQFYLYCGQTDVTQIEVKIKNEIDKHFNDMDIANNMLSYFEEWSLQELNKTELIKTDIESKLLEELLMKYVFLSSDIEEFAKPQVWNDVTDQFHFVSITNPNSINNKKCLTKVWNAVQVKLNEHLSVEMVNLKEWNNLLKNPSSIISKIQELSGQDLPIKKTKNKYKVKDIFMLLWNASKLPLIINLDMNYSKENVLYAISKFDPQYKRRYIFYGDISLCTPEEKIFANLMCVAKDRQINTLKMINVSLQKRDSISLDKLFPNENTLKEITPDVFLNLLEYDYVDNNCCGADRNLYISRFLQTPHISRDVLEENAMFVLVGDYSHSKGKLSVESNEFMKWNTYKTLPTRISTLPLHLKRLALTSVLLIHELTLEYKDIIKVIKEVRQNKEQTVHFFRINEEGHLEWLYSNQNINMIKPFRIRNVNPTFVIEDKYLFSYLRFHILSDTSGEGKTMMLEYLKDNCPTDMWMVYLNIRDINDYIKIGKFSNVVEFLYNNSAMFSKDADNMFRKLFQNLLKKLKVLIVIDGLDDIKFDSNTKEFLNEIKNLGVPTLLTTRPSLRDLLEDSFDTLSLHFKPFSEDDKKMLVQKYKSNLSEKIINQVVYKTSTLGNKLIAVPLQIKLFGGILKNINEVNFTNFDIWDLYEEYINTQLETVNVSNMSTIRTLSRLGLLQFYHTKPVAELFDVEDFYDDVEDKMKDLLKSKIIQKIEQNGATFSDKSSVTFCHKSLAEFMAAKFLHNLYNKLSKRNELRSLLQYLFYKELEIVRLFFDTIISKTSPLHKAVFEIDGELFKSRRNEICDIKDKAGRSVLHVAAAYGKYIELREIKTLSTDIKILTSYNENYNGLIYPCDENERTFHITVEFLKNLLNNNFDLRKKDELFNMDVFDFAIQSNSLEVLEVLCTSYRLKNLANTSVDTEILLYHSVKEGYWNIFNQIQNKNFKLKNGYTGENLLHIGLAAENFNIIYQIIENIDDINEPDSRGYSPLVSWLLLLKSSNRRFNENRKTIFQLLFAKKANVNSADKFGHTLLHHLMESEHISFMNSPIQNKADKNRKSNLKDISLHFATKYYLENVKLLIKRNPLQKMANNLERTSISTYNTLTILKYLILNGLKLANNEGGLALIQAALSGNTEWVELLITNGVAVHQEIKIDNIGINNVLHAAVSGGELECVKLVHQFVGPISKNMCFILLYTATKNGYSDVFNYLISSQGIDVHDQMNDNLTLLHLAVHDNDIDCVKFLLSKGVDINVKNKYGSTPLHLAVELDSVNMTTFLISKGADRDAEDSEKLTPLAKAIVKNRLNCVNVLI